jgi:CBS domain-containing protein
MILPVIDAASNSKNARASGCIGSRVMTVQQRRLAGTPCELMEIKDGASGATNNSAVQQEKTPMRAADIMVSNVITVGTTASVQDVADILIKNRISGVPVVDDAGELVGIVSEGDLLHRVEAGTEYRRSWWLDLLASKEVLADEFSRSHSRRVADVMTRRVITVDPDATLAEVAATLERNGIKRVPVVQNGKLVGIISRANLLQALTSVRREAIPTPSVDDATLRKAILDGLRSKAWARTGLLNVIVHDGTVDLWGMVDSVEEKNAVRVAVELTPGVRAVNDNLSIYPVMAAG